jgi:hypothetical protein
LPVFIVNHSYETLPITHASTWRIALTVYTFVERRIFPRVPPQSLAPGPLHRGWCGLSNIIVEISLLSVMRHSAYNKYISNRTKNKSIIPQRRTGSNFEDLTVDLWGENWHQLRLPACESTIHLSLGIIGHKKDFDAFLFLMKWSGSPVLRIVDICR